MDVGRNSSEASAASQTDSTAAIVQVRDVTKTYCRNLRKSLWYGVQDIFRELTFRGSYSGQLRDEEFEAVKSASFDMHPGECVALLGPNGAGKSTMLKMLNGILRPNRGSIRIHGRVSALIELGTGFNPILSGRENVFINAAVLGFSREETAERFDEILEFSEIGEFIDAPVQSYSSGMKVRLGFAVASHLAPDLMLIDEVLAVGDLAFRLKCYDHLQKRVESGVSVILVSHIVAMMPRFCTRAIVFDKGRIAFDGNIMEGIAEYQRILGIEKAKAQALTEDPLPETDDATERVSGVADDRSGIEPEVMIDSVQTLDPEFSPCDTFRTGDPVCVEIAIKARKDFANCKVVVNLDSVAFGVVSTMASLRQKFRFDVRAGETTRIRLHLKRLPLIEGSYSFNLSLYGDGRNHLLDQKNALGSIRILNPADTRKALKGVLVLNHEWENCGAGESESRSATTENGK